MDAKHVVFDVMGHAVIINKQSLKSRNNMDRTIKEEAIHSASEKDTMLNRLSGMFQGLESMLQKTLKQPRKTRHACIANN